MNAPEPPRAAFHPEDADSVTAAPTGAEPRLGEILRRTRGLTLEQVQRALDHQAAQGVRFGEAVVQLGLAAPADVMRAVSQQFHFPYAAVQPDALAPELVLARRPFDDDVEVFRDLRTQLMLGGFGAPGDRSALAVLGVDRGDGRSFLAANLAIAFGQLPGRTLLIDADLRAPRQHQLFRCPAGPGLAEMLSGRAEPRAARPIEAMPNLFLVPAGAVPPNPSELFLDASFPLLLSQFTERFDFVILDTSAAASGSDARVIASRCGAALAVARRHRSHLAPLQQLLAQVKKSNARLHGVLMNDS